MGQQIIGLYQPKNRLFSVVVWMRQLAKILEHTTNMDEDMRKTLMELVELMPDQIDLILRTLPDEAELDCNLADVTDVIYVEDQEEAEKVMDQILGNSPGDGENIH